MVSKTDNNSHRVVEKLSSHEKKDSMNENSQVEPVAQKIINSLANFYDSNSESLSKLQAYDAISLLKLQNKPQVDLKKDVKNEATTTSIRKKKKKFKSIESSVSTAKPSIIADVQESSALFAEGIKEGNLTSNVRFLSNEQESFLKEILDTWQLGGSITLADLLGLELDSCYEELIKTSQNIKDPSIKSLQEIFELLKTDFEAHYCLVFISLLCESNALNKAQDMLKFLDNKFLYTRDRACDIFMTRMNEYFNTIEQTLSVLNEKVLSNYPKNPRIRAVKLRPLIEIKKQIENIQKRINLFISLLKSEYALSILVDHNILGLCGPMACKVKSAQDVFLHFRKLVKFQKDLMTSAKEKKFLGLSMQDFEEFANNFPEKLSEQSLFEISKKSLKLISDLMGLQKIVYRNLANALSGKLTHDNYCRCYSLVPNRKKSKNEFISDLYAKSMAVSLTCSFAQDLHSIADGVLMPLVSNVYTIKRTSYNRMLLNFMEITDHLKQSPNIDTSRFPVFFSNTDLSSFRVKLQQDFKKIETTFFNAFDPFMKSFLKKFQKTTDIGFYSPIIWVKVFNKISPLLKELFPKMLSDLETLKQTYIKQLKPILMNLPLDQRVSAMQELKELLLNNSLMVCRIILFFADLRALMDLYEIETLKSESFLLPYQLCDLLELEELEEEIQEELLILADDSSSSSIEEMTNEEFDEGNSEVLTYAMDEISKKDQDLVQETTSLSTSIQLPKSPKKPQKSKRFLKTTEISIPKDMPTKDKKKASSDHKSKTISFPKGANMRKMLKKIKKELGLTPERIKGSHMIFKDRKKNERIAVVPYHSGGGTLPKGTKKSIEKQFNNFSKNK